MSSPRVTAVYPACAIEGGRISIEGEAFRIDQPRLPEVHVGGVPARVVRARSDRIDVLLPAGLTEGRAAVHVDGAEDEAAAIQVASPFATDLHQVDSPSFDHSGNLYVTYSGRRGEQVPVSIFRLRPNGAREPFSSEVVNPTSTAVDADGRLYVSSRFEGTVYRLNADGSAEPFATDLGVPCGLAFASDGALYVGDRSGTIFRVDRDGRATAFATLPPSVAAFHLAIGPDRAIYVTGPTLSSYDMVYRIDRAGDVTARSRAFGRPQGLAFDADGVLHVVEALAGASGVYRLQADGARELVLSGPGLVGLAFSPDRGFVVCSNVVAYRLRR
jgi:sugar lactone lactonase YvrE